MKKRMLSILLSIVIAAGLLPTAVLAAEGHGNFTPDNVNVTETSTTDDDYSYFTVRWHTRDPIEIGASDSFGNSYVYLKFKLGSVPLEKVENNGWGKVEYGYDGGYQILKLYFTQHLLLTENAKAYCYIQIPPGATVKELGTVSAFNKLKTYGGDLILFGGKKSDSWSDKIATYKVGTGNGNGYGKMFSFGDGINTLWQTDTGYTMNRADLKSASVSVSATDPSLPKGQTVSVPISVSALTKLDTDAAKAYTGLPVEGVSETVRAKVSGIKYTGPTDYGDSVYFSEKAGTLYLNVDESIYNKIGDATSIQLPLEVTVTQTLTDNTVTGSHTITLTRPKVSRGANIGNMTFKWGANVGYYKIAQQATMTANEDYQLPDSIKVTVDGKELTAGVDYTYDKNTGILNIHASAVTGGVQIDAYAEKTPEPLDDIKTALPGFNEGTWYNESNSTLTTASGWTVSDSRNGTFSDFITLDGEGNPATKTLYFQNSEGVLYSYELKYKRDTTAPVIGEISGVPEDTYPSAEVSFVASDATSGVKDVTVTCGDGEAVIFDRDSFTADRNGTYTITVTDNAGHQTTEIVTVENIHVHHYTYTLNEENAAQIIESCTCGHRQTATLVYSTGDGKYPYSNSAITPVKVTYSEDWAGDRPTGITYLDNKNAGRGAKGTLTIGGKTATKTFEITPYDIGNATVTINPASGKFTGLAYAPAVMVETEIGTLVEGTDYDVLWNETELINVGTYTATITGGGNFMGQIRRPFEITNGWNPAVNNEYTVSAPNGNGWLKDDFVITAKTGYKLSLTNTAAGEWGDTLTGTVEGADSRVNFYVKNTADGTISEMATASYKLDKGNPTGKVSFDERTGWENFLHTISFGLFYKDEVTVQAEAQDNLSGVAKIEFIEASEEMSLEELQSSHAAWGEFPENGQGVTLKDAKRFIYYIRITDNAGNVTYISTDGAEYDTTAPAISGIENGATYYATQKVTVTDKNVASVLLNGKEATAKITLDGNRDVAYTIIAADKAGNQTEVTVTMKPIASLAGSISALTEENVKSSEKGSIEQVKSSLQEVDFTDATEEEKAALDELIAKCDALLQAISDVAAELKELTDAVNSYAPDLVKSSDKEDIQDLIDKMDALISGDNLTDEEKGSLQEPKDKANALLEKINDTLQEMQDVTEEINGFDIETVKSSDKAGIQSLADRIEALLEGDNLAQSEREAFGDIKDKANALLDKINKTGKEISDISETLDDYAVGTVKSSDKDAVEELLDRTEALLSGDNITEAEREKSESVQDAVQALLDKIFAVAEEYERIAEEVGSYDLETVTADDKGDMGNLKDDIDKILATENLTDEEILELNGNKTKLENCLDRLESVEELMDELSEGIEKYEESSVKSTDKEAIEQIIKDAETLIGTENVTADEKATLESIAEKGNQLIDKIAESADASQSDAIQAAEDITADNVALEDKGTLEDALKDLTDALENNGGNYTETEKAELQDKIVHIEEALDVIEKVENIQELIDKLPDAENVKLSDEKTISSAKDAYDKLSDYEKTLIDTNKLNKVVKAFDTLSERMDEDISSPNTGDNTSITLWFVILLLSAFCVVGMSIYSKKKKAR